MYEVSCFASGKDCIAALYKKPAIITVDYSLPDMQGKELLARILAVNPETAVIIISGQKDITTAIELLKQGAYDYIVKDENTRDHLWNSLRLLQETIRLRIENERLHDEVEKKFSYSGSIIGNSPGIREAFS